ncbi:MAG: MurR/RpiR family transcriptional regulator [Paracoccaceae bacterium]
MTEKSPPSNYEDLIRLIHELYDGLSPANQQIAVFLTQNPNDIAVHSINVLGRRCGVHASSLVRFAQQFGYSGFKELQRVFQLRLVTAAPGFEARANRLKAELGADDADAPRGHLKDLVVRDIASLEEVLSNTTEESFDRAVEILRGARNIYLLGQLRSEPIVSLVRYLLTMLGRRAILLDASGGLATHMARTMEPRDALFAVSFRFYATEVVNIAEDARRNGIPIIAITDSTLSPLAKSASVLFSVPEHEYTFSRSLAAPICLAQALMIGLAAKLNRSDSPRIPTVTQR